MPVNILENKPMNLAVRTYHPFSPDAGILCGGYQGPLYPQPTSFYLPDAGTQGIEVVQYQKADADSYQMKTTGDFYEGLGEGNPSINYRNPGHIVGLMDTMARMAYGLAIIKSSHDAVYDSEEDMEPAANIELALTILHDPEGAYGDGSISPEDLYPDWCEEPYRYIEGMIDDEGILQYNPYLGQPFEYDEDDRYEPAADEVVDCAPFENALTWESYLEMHSPFREMFVELVEFCEENFQEEAMHWLEQDGLCKEGTMFTEVPHPLITNSDDDDDWPEPDGTQEGTVASGEAYVDMPGYGWDEPLYKQLCIPLESGKALELITKSDEAHNGPGVQHEYRTFHEMNGVINILPVQMYGISYSRMQEYTLISDAIEIGTHEWHGGWIICDIILNTNLKTNFALTGTATFNYEVDPSGIDTFTICRSARVITSVTNKYIWNRSWHGFPENDEVDIPVDESVWNSTDLWTYHSGFDPGEGGIEPFNTHKPPHETDTEFDLSASVDTDGTGQSVRFRIIIQSQMIRFEGDFHHVDKVSLEFALTNGDAIDINLEGALELEGTKS